MPAGNAERREGKERWFKGTSAPVSQAFPPVPPWLCHVSAGRFAGLGEAFPAARLGDNGWQGQSFVVWAGETERGMGRCRGTVRGAGGRCWSPGGCQGKGGFGVLAGECAAPLLPRVPQRDGARSYGGLGFFWFPHWCFLCANLLPPRSGGGRGRGGGGICPAPVASTRLAGWVQSCSLLPPGLGPAGFRGGSWNRVLHFVPATPLPLPPPARPRVKRKEAASLLQNNFAAAGTRRMEEAARCHRSPPRPLP